MQIFFIIWLLCLYLTVINCEAEYDNTEPSNSHLGLDEVTDDVIPRISGGNDVKPSHKYPFMVRVEGFGKSCGGSLINKQFVLSAAQCLPASARMDANGRVDDKTSRAFTVYVGVQKKTDKCMAVPATLMVHYPQFKLNSDTDILLIKLQSPINETYREIVQPLELPNSTELERRGTVATILGWGSTSADRINGSLVLKETSLAILSGKECEIYHPPSQFTICAGTNYTGPCLGDEGGPLFVKRNGKFYIVGIISAPGVCGEGPGRFTRVSLFVTWIKQNIERFASSL